MSKLISGKEALIALANGDEVQHFNKKMATFGNLVKDEEWGCCDELTISDFNSDLWAFRLKPRTITINGIEVAAPFEPKEDDQFWYLDSSDPQGYNTDIRNHEEMFSKFKKTAFCQIGLWRTEEEIKQVVAALRSVFGKK